jgi:hypothetical protein
MRRLRIRYVNLAVVLEVTLRPLIKLFNNKFLMLYLTL